jgi:branched-chain amino acid transport system ATP-binding protein
VESLLQVANISKSFGGIKAIHDVSFTLRQKEILGLIGPNGAGKTTLFNVIAGVYKPDSGEITFKGRKISGLRPHRICHLGIARTFQIVKPFLTLTVLENVMIGSRCGKSEELVDRWDYRSPALEVLDLLNLAVKKDTPSESLNLAEKKRVELARALATRPEIILLDEVAAGLTPGEIEEIITLIYRIRDEMKMGILMIEHNMRAVMGVSDRVMVLHHGEKIADGTPESVVRNEEVINAYLGERII